MLSTHIFYVENSGLIPTTLINIEHKIMITTYMHKDMDIIISRNVWYVKNPR